MRARNPDVAGWVERDGVRLGYELFGTGEPTLLLLPTWTIAHSHVWKMQVPYLSRFYRVITYDGPGNGRSDRVTNPNRYTPDSYADDAAAVLDECGVEKAVLVGFSRGAAYAVRMATSYPERVSGMVLVAPALPLSPPAPGREDIARAFLEPYPENPQGWAKYNLSYWHDQYEDFATFFFEQAFSEAHSTKPREDALGWALETGPEVLEAEAKHPPSGFRWPDLLQRVTCPSMVIHGTADRIQPHATGVEAARLTGGSLMSMIGTGHIPHARDPVRFNLALRDFIRAIAPPQRSPVSPTRPDEEMRDRVWIRGLDRGRRVLYLSSPIGLGHARRDLAIAQALHTHRPDVEIHWLSQEPVTTVLERAGQSIHPASQWLASESGHITSEAAGHDLHCFQALRSMDEILLANFMIFQDVVEDGAYDLVVGDEAWDVDHFWHENPELKRGSHVWMTDFVGYIPMPEGGQREAFLTADYNAEMIEHIARFPRIRDRAIFVGNPDDIVSDAFGSGLPKIRDWTEDHFEFSGYVTGFTPPTPDEIVEWRGEFGYKEWEKICVVTVGGSGVGHNLLERAIAALPLAREAVPDLRMVAVAGPRIDPESLPSHPGLEVHGYVDQLYRHLAVCDLAVVQGGLTTTMELTAAQRPFLYFPLRDHFEQNFHVRHRLDQYGAGRYMEYATTTVDDMAEAMVAEVGNRISYRNVETGGADRAARMIAELL